MIERTNYIVTQDEFGNDRIWAGVKNGEHSWTLHPDKARELSAGLAIELLRDFRDHDHNGGPRVVSGYAGYGPDVRLDRNDNFKILGV